MNKKKKEEKVTNFIAEKIELEVRHHLYDEINEHIFDRNLANESCDGRYARETMIDHEVHPFSDDVTDIQVHVAFNQIYQEVIHRLKEDY